MTADTQLAIKDQLATTVQPAITAQLATTVRSLIEQETAATVALINSLEEEKKALSTRDSPGLHKCVEIKAKTIVTLEQLSKYRLNILAAHGLDSSNEAWNVLLQTLAKGSDSDILDKWNQLKVLAKRSYELNQVNGKIVNRTRQTVQRLLTILRGQPDSVDLYDQLGRSTNRQRGVSGPVVKA